MGSAVPTRKEYEVVSHGRIRRTAVSAAVVAALTGALAIDAHAAGLGRLTVQSALGQPLSAEVEITSLTQDEAQSLSAKLAPPDAFQQAGLEYNPALSNLSFKVERRSDGRAVVKITSTRVVNEPFVDLLVELNWAAGKFVREYTFLLDPPELRFGRQSEPAGTGAMTQAVPPPPAVATPVPAPVAPQPARPRVESPEPAPAAVVAAPAPAPKPVAAAPAPRVAEPVVSQPAPPAPRAVARPAPAPARASESVEVKSGDTLASIAGRVKPAGVSLEQAIVSIYKANPSAFFGGVHQLRADTTLQIPDAQAMAALDAGEVRAEMRRSLTAFNEYRARLAGAARKVATAKTGQSAVGSIAEKAPTEKPTEAKGDQLKLSRGASAGGGTSAGSVGGANAQEGEVARQTALREAQSRVAELEKNVSDLQRLLELKNQQLSEVQQKLAKAPPSASGAVQPAPSGSAASGSDSAPTNTPSGAGTEAKPAMSAPAVAEQVKPEQAKPEQAKPEPTKPESQGTAPVANEQGSASGTTAPMTKPDAAAPVASAAAPAAAAPAAPVAKPAAPAAEAPASTDGSGGGILDDVMANPYLLPGGVALLALGGFYAWYSRRKRKSEDNFEDSLGASDAFTANSLFGTTGGQDVDTTSNSLFNSNIRDSGVDVHSTEVDPIAEAEVYVAYGREAQAEEILKEALKKQPERQAIRLKLLEIYAGRKDVAAFAQVATEMYEQTGGQNEEWPKVVTLGLSIDPDNPLYTGHSGGAGDKAQASDQPTSGSGGAIAGAAVAAAGTAGLIDALGADTAPDTKAGMDFGAPATASAGMDFEATKELNEDRDEMSGLDFDLDVDSKMGLSGGDTGIGASTATLGAPATQPKIDEVLPDLSFDANLGEAVSAAKPEGSDLSRALEGKIELPSLNLDDDKTDFSDTVAREHVEPDAIADLGDFKVDIPSIETLRGPASAEADGVDLSAIGLDLSPNTITGGASGETNKWQEMATKLDLASAYEEIGDKDGARELLEEVLKDGDSQQQQKARAMLSKIS